MSDYMQLPPEPQRALYVQVFPEACTADFDVYKSELSFKQANVCLFLRFLQTRGNISSNLELVIGESKTHSPIGSVNIPATPEKNICRGLYPPNPQKYRPASSNFVCALLQER